MPKLYCRENGGYYTRVPIENKIATFQIDEEGVKILATLGYRKGENFDINDFWRLKNNGHVYTMGQETLTAEYYGEERLIVKPEGSPDLIDPKYGPGWIYERRDPYIEILFREDKRFKIIGFIEAKYPFTRNVSEDVKYDREELVNKVIPFTRNRAGAERAVDCILKSIKTALCAKEPVEIEGFGRFNVKVKKKKKKKLTEEGSEVIVEKMKWKVKFHPSTDLIDASLYKVRFMSSKEIRDLLSR